MFFCSSTIEKFNKSSSSTRQSSKYYIADGLSVITVEPLGFFFVLFILELLASSTQYDNVSSLLRVNVLWNAKFHQVNNQNEKSRSRAKNEQEWGQYRFF
jgi:hypothetical protein